MPETKPHDSSEQTERRQQTIIGCVTVVIAVILLGAIGFLIWHNHETAQQRASNTPTASEAYAKLQKVETKPSKADDKGGILIGRDGYGKAVDGAPTIGVYMDFICPGCGSLNQQLDPILVKLMKAGQVNLDLHFMAFMDSLSTDRYSSRAANAAVYISEHDDNPDHLLGFVSKMYDADYQPKEGSGYEPTDNEKIAKRAELAGVPKNIRKNMFNGEYEDWLAAVSTYTSLREELFTVAEDMGDGMSTPTVTVNGKFWDFWEMGNVSTLQGFLAAIGLSADDIGDSSAMPSVGSTKGPLFPVVSKGD